MRDTDARSAGRPSQGVLMSPSESVLCEQEARHDVVARGRVADPAAALGHYLSHVRVEEELRHHDRSAAPAPPPEADPRDTFAKQHPLVASWLRWGEPPR